MPEYNPNKYKTQKIKSKKFFLLLTLFFILVCKLLFIEDKLYWNFLIISTERNEDLFVLLIGVIIMGRKKED